jgi:hypothetical protein
MELEPGLDPSVASPVGPRRHGSARFSWRPHPILQNRLLHSSPPSRIRPPPPPPPLPTSQGHSSPVPHGGELQETTATTASPSTPAAPLASHHHPSPTTVSIPAAASCGRRLRLRITVSVRPSLSCVVSRLPVVNFPAIRVEQASVLLHFVPRANYAFRMSTKPELRV